MAQRRNATVGVCLVLAASLFGLSAFVQPSVLRPSAGARIASGVALKAGAQEQAGAEGASWSMPLVAGVAAFGLMLSMAPAPAQAVDKLAETPGTRSWVVDRDVTYDVPGEDDLFAKISARNLKIEVAPASAEALTKAVEALQAPAPAKKEAPKAAPAPAAEAPAPAQ